MAVRIRLTRVGATKRPSYRVVAIDRRRARDGRALEILGFYDPLTEPATVKIDTDKIKAWIGKGAQPSDMVVRLMRQAESGDQRPAPATKPAAKPKARKTKTAAAAPKAETAAAAPKAGEAPAEAEAPAAPAEEAATPETEEPAAEAAPEGEPAAEEPAAEAAPDADESTTAVESDEPAAAEAAAAADEEAKA